MRIVQSGWKTLVAFLLLCLVIQLLGSGWTQEGIRNWYPTLHKPFWTPPDWLFAPVWTLLYLMIALAGGLIYQAPDSPRRSIALAFYIMQLLLNFLWSFLFFSLQRPDLALLDIVGLTLFIILTMVKAWPVSRLASLLLLPYLAWVLYATSLNLGIWLLN